MASNVFFGLTTLYGIMRTVPVMQHIELPGTRLMTGVVGVISTPIFFPAFVANDLNRTYIKIHNLDFQQFGYKNRERRNLQDLLFE